MSHRLMEMGYFNYGHLPEHLQPLSKPFFDIASKFSNSDSVWPVLDMVSDLAKRINSCEARDPVEASVAVEKLERALNVVSKPDLFLRLVLEAKDCAVRSGLKLTDLKQGSL